MLVLLLGLAGPLLALPKKFGIPVAVGELAAGVIFGHSGLCLIDPGQPNLSLLSQIGFALVMMVTASSIDVRRLFKASNSLPALGNIGLVAVGAIALASLVGQITGQVANVATFAVILASSSAAVVLPVFAQSAADTKANKAAKGDRAAKGKSKREMRKSAKEFSSVGYQRFISQVAIADLLAIVALPLVMGSGRALQVGVGAAIITLAAAAVYFLLRWLNATGYWKRMRSLSTERGLGLELRISLILLLGLILIAQSFTVTIMIAGFGLGLAIAANGLPRRLAKQLFAVSEGFFSPIFFVLLGAGIDVSAVFGSPGLFGLALMLGIGAIAVHMLPVFLGLRFRFAVASSAQLGVPAAAVAIGFAQHSLSAGQGAAIMLGALMTLAATAVAAAAKGDAKN
ncbi:MAG: hypothetical protein RJA35_1446 [Actinomycetota bacterium]|jgi:Kef-type K+ transport system membrane component KefB